MLFASRFLLIIKKKNKELGLKIVEREREKKRRERWGKWEKIKNSDDVAFDNVATEYDVVLTSDVLLVQRVNFQPHQPTTQRHISLLGYKNFLDILVKIESNVG